MKSLVAILCIFSVCDAFQSPGARSKLPRSQPSRAVNLPQYDRFLKRQVHYRSDGGGTALWLSPLDLIPGGVDLQLLAGAAVLLAAGTAANSGKKKKPTSVTHSTGQSTVSVEEEPEMNEEVYTRKKEAEKEKLFQDALVAAAVEMQAASEAESEVFATESNTSQDEPVMLEEADDTTLLPSSTPFALDVAETVAAPETELAAQDGAPVIPNNRQSVQPAIAAKTTNLQSAQMTAPIEGNKPQPASAVQSTTPVQRAAAPVTQGTPQAQGAVATQQPQAPAAAQQDALQNLKKTYSFEDNNEKAQTNELRQLLQKQASQQTLERMKYTTKGTELVPRASRIAPPKREQGISKPPVTSKIAPPKRQNVPPQKKPAPTPSKREQLKESITGLKGKLKTDSSASELKSVETTKDQSGEDQDDGKEVEVVKDEKASVRGFLKKRSVLLGAFVLVVGRRLILTWMGRGMM